VSIFEHSISHYFLPFLYFQILPERTESYTASFCIKHHLETTSKSGNHTIKDTSFRMHLTTLILSVLATLIIPTTATMTVTNGTTQKPLRVGVFFEEVQMTDLAGLDFFGHNTPEIMAINVAIDPSFEHLMALTTPMEFLYISSSLETSWVTPKMDVKPTHTYANAPRDLDVLLLGGPNPATVKEESLQFLKEASKQTKVIMTTCTGAVWLARSGALDGKKATTNRVFLPKAKEIAPKVEWVDQQWVIDDGHFEGAQIWTAGGARCGMF
jgi:hypothetical protein